MAAALQMQLDHALAQHAVRHLLDQVRRAESRQRVRDAAAVFVPAQQARDVVERDVDAGELAAEAERKGIDDDPFRAQRLERVDDGVAAGDALVGPGRGDDHGVVDAQRVEHAARASHVPEAAADGVVDDHRFRAVSSAIMMYFSVIGMRSKRKTAYDGSSFPVAFV